MNEHKELQDRMKAKRDKSNVRILSEAMRKANHDHGSGETVCTMDEKTGRALEQILHYVKAAEERDYIERPEDEQARHVYRDWQIVAKWFDENMWPHLYGKM